MSADLLPEVLLALALLLVAGAGCCLATRVAVGRAFVTFLGLAFGLGFAIVAGLSLVLALAGVLGPASLGIGWVAISAAVWILAIRRGGLAEHARAWRRRAAADPWASIGIGVTVLGAVVVRWTVDPLVNLAPTVLRYWADGLEIADAGRIPETTLQWGRVLPTAGSKIALSAFDAAGATLLGRGPIRPLAALLFVVSLGLLVITLGIFAELGMRRWAPVAALVLFLTPIDLAVDLQKNLAEDWGRMVAFAAILAAVLALRRPRSTAGEVAASAEEPRTRATLVVAGVLLGVAAATHLVAACVAIATLGALAAAIVLVSPGEAWRRALIGAAAVVGVALVVGVAILAVAPGDLGFQGAVDQGSYADLREELSLPPTFDPTLFIAMNDLGSPTARSAPGLADVARQFAYRLVGANAYQDRPGPGPPPWLVIAPTVVALALAVLLIVRGPTDLKLVAVLSVILAVGLFAVGLLFAFRYDVFALEFFGNRRLFPYAAVPFVAIGAATAEAATRWLGGRIGASRAAIVALVLVLASAAVLLPRGGTPASVTGRAAQLALLERVRREVPCEGRVLATHRTLGTFQTIAGRAGVLEGMGPHVRPSVLRLAVEEILAAQDFFADPAGGREYLRSRGVDAIVVARGSPAYAFGGYRVARVPPDRLDRVPFLRRWFENDAGIVYRVEGAAPDASLPKVEGRPGFACD
jgi:hypothetical protein